LSGEESGSQFHSLEAESGEPITILHRDLAVDTYLMIGGNEEECRELLLIEGMELC